MSNGKWFERSTGVLVQLGHRREPVVAEIQIHKVWQKFQTGRVCYHIVSEVNFLSIAKTVHIN